MDVDNTVERMARATTARRSTRREVLLGTAKVAAGGTLMAALIRRGLDSVAAQGTPPSSALASLGLPQITVTATDAGFMGAPGQVPAGRYLLTFTNQATSDASAGFLQLPPGKTLADLPSNAPNAMATPGPGVASPVASPSPAALAWLYQTYIAGGAGAAAGQTAQAVVDLKPGSYAIWGDDPNAKQKALPLTVTGAAPSAPKEPAAAVTIQEVNTAHGFAFRLQGRLTPGPQVVKVVNLSDQPHFVLLLRSPGPITMAQLMQLLSLPENATPPPGLPNPNQFRTAAYAGIQSAGVTSWHLFDLTAATYVLACFVPDKNTGRPHAAEGMIDLLTLSSTGTQLATPPS